MKKLLIVFFVFLFVGCATSQLCTVPEAENSVVCNLSEKLKTTPEVISQTLQVANLGALEANIYTAREADKFLNTLIADITGIQESNKVITFMDAVNYIDKKFKVLPPRIQAVFVLINPAGLAGQNIKLPLTSYDFDLLLRHLNKQKALVNIYL